ncbi:MAG: hypothetical protein WC911_01655 [Thermoleophilia bacterium]
MTRRALDKIRTAALSLVAHLDGDQRKAAIGLVDACTSTMENSMKYDEAAGALSTLKIVHPSLAPVFCGIFDAMDNERQAAIAAHGKSDRLREALDNEEAAHAKDLADLRREGCLPEDLRLSKTIDYIGVKNYEAGDSEAVAPLMVWLNGQVKASEVSVG